MLRAFRGLPVLTVDELSRLTTLDQNDNGLYTRDLVTLGIRTGLYCRLSNTLTLETIENEIAAGRPLIALVLYSYLPRQNVTDKSGHFVVVTGITDTHVIINDPDYWGGRSGEAIEVPRSDFQLALSRMTPAYQGVLLA